MHDKYSTVSGISLVWNVCANDGVDIRDWDVVLLMKIVYEFYYYFRKICVCGI